MYEIWGGRGDDVGCKGLRMEEPFDFMICSNSSPIINSHQSEGKFSIAYAFKQCTPPPHQLQQQCVQLLGRRTQPLCAQVGNSPLNTRAATTYLSDFQRCDGLQGRLSPPSPASPSPRPPSRSPRRQLSLSAGGAGRTSLKKRACF